MNMSTKILFSVSDMKVGILRNGNGYTFIYNFKKYQTVKSEKITGHTLSTYRSIRDLINHGVIEELPVKLAVCGILTVGNRIVAVKRKTDDFYGLIGGKVDDGENIHQALLRETLEETGYNVEIRHSFNCYVEEDSSGYLTACFLLRLREHGHGDQKEGEVPYLYLMTKDQLLAASAFRNYNERAFDFFNI